MVCLAGEIVLPGQSFHQWTHLGKETSAHLGPFTAQGYRIIKSWSEIMAEVLSLKQFLHMKTQRRYISHLDLSILLPARIKLLFAVVDKHNFMPRPNDIYRLCFVSPQTAVNFSFSTSDVPRSKRPGPFHMLDGKEASVMLATVGFQKLGSNWMWKSVYFFINIRNGECTQLTMYPKADVQRF